MSWSASRAWMTSGSCVCAGRGDVTEEGDPLRLARRVVVVVVEPGFADRHDLRIGGEPHKVSGRHVGFFGGIVRVGADRAVDPRIALDQIPELREARDPRRDGHDGLDSSRAGAIEDRVAILVEVGEIEMAVAVDEHAIPAQPTASRPVSASST